MVAKQDVAKKLEEISSMSEEELEAFAKQRFRCLYHERRTYTNCEMCNGYNHECPSMITESHIESFYNLFDWKK